VVRIARNIKELTQEETLPGEKKSPGDIKLEYNSNKNKIKSPNYIQDNEENKTVITNQSYSNYNLTNQKEIKLDRVGSKQQKISKQNTKNIKTNEVRQIEVAGNTMTDKLHGHQKPKDLKENRADQIKLNKTKSKNRSVKDLKNNLNNKNNNQSNKFTNSEKKVLKNKKNINQKFIKGTFKNKIEQKLINGNYINNNDEEIDDKLMNKSKEIITHSSTRIVKNSLKAPKQIISAPSKIRSKDINKVNSKYLKNQINTKSKIETKKIGANIINDVERIHGSDDEGIIAVRTIKDTTLTSIRSSQRTVKTFKSASNKLKNVQKKIRKNAQRINKGTRKVYKYLGKIFDFLYRVITLQTTGLVLMLLAIIFVIMMAVTSITSLIPNLTFTSKDEEIANTIGYITELDTTINYDIVSTEDDNSHIDRFHYYKNGSSTSVSHMTIETDIQILLTYLNTKYDDFKLNEVEDKIDTIHNELYSLSFNEWTENWTTESTSTNPVTGETTTTTHHHSREHLDTELDTENFESYMNDNIDDLLDENQKEKYESLLEIGGMTLRQELGSPFINDEWENNITSGFGWRVHPVDENKDFHQALDIAFPIGTPINAVMGGTVTNIGNNSSYGKYIVIEIGNTKTLYAHCSSIEKNINDQIIKGDIIAKVGNTGTSTGSHLHLEYIKDGIYLPPDYYLSKN
jgi:hypothetical protein